MDPRRLDTVNLALIAGSFALSALLYLWLPDQIPGHWNAAGEVDRMMGKGWGAFLLPLMMLGLYGVFRIIPALSPKDYAIEAGNTGFVAIRVAVFALLAVLNLLILLSGLGVAIAMDSAVSIGVGTLFVVLGFFLNRLPRNFYVGIRTPWAIVDEDNWTRTHRLGRWFFILGGLAIIASGLMGGSIYLVVAAALAAAFGPMVYSFLIYREQQRKA